VETERVRTAPHPIVRSPELGHVSPASLIAVVPISGYLGSELGSHIAARCEPSICGEQIAEVGVAVHLAAEAIGHTVDDLGSVLRRVRAPGRSGDRRE
jgi:hypothetical protein